MSKPKIQLSGEDGNSFVIIGQCMKVARKAGWTSEKLTKFREEAMSGNYDHLLRTVMKYFEVD